MSIESDITTPSQSDDLREEIADVLAEYDRSRRGPTGDAVEIEIRASDRLVGFIQTNYIPKPPAVQARAAIQAHLDAAYQRGREDKRKESAQ